jgi:hypothetical protein
MGGERLSHKCFDSVKRFSMASLKSLDLKSKQRHSASVRKVATSAKGHRNTEAGLCALCPAENHPYWQPFREGRENVKSSTGT